jgi:hypothetical protein
VSLHDGEFIISNYRKKTAVPTSALVSICEDRWNRTPSIALFFDPPTAFGRKIRIIPPWDFRGQKFNLVAQVLREILELNRHRSGSNSDGGGGA